MANWWDDPAAITAAAATPAPAANWWDQPDAVVDPAVKREADGQARLAQSRRDYPGMPESRAPADVIGSVSEGIADAGLALRSGIRSGIQGLVEAPVNLVNAAVRYTPVNVAARALGATGITGAYDALTLEQPAAADFVREGVRQGNARDTAAMSDAAGAQDEALQNREGFVDSAGYILSRPSMMAREGARTLGLMLPGMAAPAGTATQLATQGAMAGSLAADQVKQAIAQMPPELVSELAAEQGIRGTDVESVRAQLMNASGTEAFAGSAVLNSLLPKLVPGGSTVERLLGRGASVGGSRVRNSVVGAVGEGITEGIAEGGEQAQQNILTGRPVGEGVGQATAFGTILGAPTGGVAGALDGGTKKPPIRDGEDLLNGTTVASQLPTPAPKPAPVAPTPEQQQRQFGIQTAADALANQPVPSEQVFGLAPVTPEDSRLDDLLAPAAPAGLTQGIANGGRDAPLAATTTPPAVDSGGPDGSFGVAPSNGAVATPVAPNAPDPAQAEDYAPRLAELRGIGKQRTPEQTAEYAGLLETDRTTSKVGGKPLGVRNLTAYEEARDAGELKPAQAFIDLDSFKRVNDEFGHSVGDDVIRQVATALRDKIGADNVFHRSGDEFIVQGDNDAAVSTALDEVRNQMADAEFSIELADGSTRTRKGVGFSFGLGPTIEDAERAQATDKQDRAARGLRTERRGLAVEPAAQPVAGAKTKRARDAQAPAKQASTKPERTKPEKVVGSPAFFRRGARSEAVRLADGSWMVRHKVAKQWQAWEPRDSFDASPTFGYRQRNTASGTVRIPSVGLVKIGDRAAPEPKAAKRTPDLIELLSRVGLSREAFQSEGIDPSEFKRTSGVGRWLFPRKGGMTLHNLREWMQENGYLDRDPEDSTPVVGDDDALQLLQRALQGESIYSNEQSDIVAAEQQRERDELDEDREAAELAALDNDAAETFSDDGVDYSDLIEQLERLAGVEIAPGDEAAALSVVDLVERLHASGMSEADAVAEVQALDGLSEYDQVRVLTYLIDREEARRGAEQRPADENRPSGLPEGQRGSTVAGQEESGSGTTADEGRSAEALTLEAPTPPAEKPAPPTDTQGGLFAAPTNRERIAAAGRDKDAKRDGRNPSGSQAMRDGDGELFAGPRPEQLDVESAAAQAATSPTNDRPEPTDAQKEAGNYKVGRIRLHGLDISIENPAGTRRRPEWPPLAHHYGYFRGTVGKDKDHVDVFIGPDAENANLPVFVIDQNNKAGRLDEHKVMLGFDSEAAARAGYLANYSKGWGGLGAITRMSLDEFKAWVRDPEQTKKRAAPPAAITPKTAKPTAKPAKPKKRTQADVAADYYIPGRVVRSYGGSFDEVLAFVRTPDGNWSVRVHEVKKVGDEWIRQGRPQDARNHRTMPDAREIARGPVAELDPVSAEQVPYSEPRGDGKPHSNAVARGAPAAPAVDAANAKTVEKIEDVGEKIGGARKDTSVSTGPGRKKATDDARPAWARRFEISQIVSDGGMIGEARNAGRWTVRDLRSLDRMGQARQVGRDTFATKEEAEAFIPIAAVGMKHRAVPTRDGKYEIWRDITDRKRVKVVSREFDTRVDALQYMLENAVSIIETNTTFGEADIPLPPDRARTGPERRTGSVKGADFKDAFGFRAVEFGNWNNQDERQALMNDAYDGMMDLADVLGIPPKAIGLNGDLALAFGARGHGLQSARAHYELDRAVINLTKEKGAGSLAHEWFHALDHYFGRQDGKASATWEAQKDGTRVLKVGRDGGDSFVSGGFTRNKSGVRPEVREAYERLLITMTRKAETYVEDTAKVDSFTGRAKEDLAQQLDGIRRELAAQKDKTYYKRNNAPASSEQLAEFDAIAKAMVDGDVVALATDFRSIPESKARIAARWTNDNLERLSVIYKDVRGRSGFDGSKREGMFDRLRGYMERYSQRLKMLADAQSNTEKTRMVPTQFAMDARELDQGRGTDYWTTPHEMAARAFQGYVEDAVAERGGLSRFLNYGPANAMIETPWGFKRPFPAGQERATINAAIDGFVKALQTREDDAGNVALFSLGKSRSGLTPATDEEMNRVAVRVLGVDSAKRRIRVVPWEQLPEAIRDEAQRVGATAEDVRAVHWRGHTYLLSGAFGSTRDVERALFHEHYTHFGLAAMWQQGKGRELSKLLDRVGGAAGVMRLAAEQKIDLSDYAKGLEGDSSKAPELKRQILIEELLAHMAESTGSLRRLIEELVGAVRAWLRERGYMELAEFGATDLAAILRDARRAALDVDARGSDGRPMFMLSAEQDQTKTAAFRKWFGDSKVVDAQGEPLVVYHGTQAVRRKVNIEAGKARSADTTLDFDVFDMPSDGFELGAHFGNEKQAKKFGPAFKFYLSIQNPLRLPDLGTWNYQSVMREAQYDGVRISEAEYDAVFNAKDNNAALKELLEKKGYDGVWYPNRLEGKGKSYIAFRPEQIKSATGNVGTFDPNNADIRFSLIPRTPEQAAALTKAGLPQDRRSTFARMRALIGKQWQALRALATENVQQRVFDRFHRMRAIEQDLGINAEESAYLSARLAVGLPSIMEGVMLYGAPEWKDGVLVQKDKTKGLLDALKPVKDDLDGWLGWMVGRRAEVLKRQGRENLMSNDDIKALLSLADGREAEFKQAALDYLEIKKAVLDVAEQAGLIDATTRPTWDSVEYIPFYRQADTDEDVIGPGTRKALAGQSSGIQKLKGGDQGLADPLGNIIRNFTRLIDASLKNNAMLEAIDQYGPAYFEKAGMGGAFAYVPLTEVKKTLLASGVPQSIIDAMPQGTLQGIARMWSIKPPADEDVVRVMRDGKPEYYRVPDPLLVRSLTSFKAPNKHWAVQPFIWAKRLLTGGITAGPEFMLRNFIRDSGSAWVISDDRFRLGWDSVVGVVKPLIDDADKRAMMFAGGSFIGGQIHGGSPDETAKALRRSLRKKGLKSKQIEDHIASVVSTPAALWDRWQAVGSALENANRNAIYEQAIKAGRSPKEAAYMARDLMDFSMQGDSKMIQLMADVLPFFNARLQGLYKLYRQGGKQHLRRALLARTGSMVVASSVLLAWNLLMFGGGYDDLEEWDRDTYWHIAPGTDFHIRIPKPFELGVLFATVPERMLMAIAGKDRLEQTASSMLSQLAGTLALNPIPQGIMPILETWANKSFFTGRPIENMGDQQLLPEARAEWYTSDMAQLLSGAFGFGNATGLSPKRIEHLWNGYTGTMGAYSLDTVDWLVRQVVDGPERPTLAWSELPLLKAIYRGDAEPKSTRYNTEFYELHGQATRASQTIKEFVVAGDDERADALEAEWAWLLGDRLGSAGAKGGFMHSGVREFNRTRDRLSAIRNEINGIIAMPGIDPDQKRKEIEELANERNALTKDIIEAYRAAQANP